MNQKSMVVAASEFSIENDGRLKLVKMSVALFGKDDGRGVEINTVRADTAFLTFDKPLGENEKDLGGNRRVIAAELIDHIDIVNNHRTPQRDDDLHLNIDKGPLYYDEAKRLIWTADNIHVEDDQNKPPTDVRGQGMEVHLAAAEAPPKPTDKPAPRGKPKAEAFTGVERIVLLANVDMNLYVAGGFLSNASGGDSKGAAAKDGSPAPAKAAAPPEKAHISIYTPGRFEYVFRKDGDLARFDVPEAPAAKDGQDILVDRITTAPQGKGVLHDQLFCQHLELRMAPKEDGPGARDHAADHAMQVQIAHAFGDKEVVLASDAQNLTARGYDFQYDARSQLTILKGDAKKPDSQMWADSDGNLIHAHEMQIRDMKGPDAKAWRQVTAYGPGRLDLIDKKTEKRPLHATWQDKLLSTKDGAQDLMILTGSAVFVDDEHQQTLQADTLKVWLASADDAPANATPAAPKDARRPNHVEAIGNVSAKSPQMTIPHAGQLLVWFHDVHDDEPLPPAGPAAKDAKTKDDAPAVREAAKPVGPAAPDLSTPPPPPPGATAGTKPNPAKADAEPPRPIDLTARSVYAWVVRGKEKNTLERLQAEGDVVVLQAPAKGEEKGVDIRGAALDMTYHPEGNFLVVQGDLAQLQMDKIYIVGPEVNIDQAANKAWVNGPGAMQMESATNFQGEKLSKPVPMTVQWNKEMFFTGRFAEFTDGVQGEQDNARLACNAMSVAFDKPISLKEGSHDGPPPHVKKLVCHGKVRVEDRTLEGDRVVRSTRLQAPALDEEAIEPDDDAPAPGGKGQGEGGSDGNEVHAPGPGDLRIFQVGGDDDDPLAAPRPPGQPKPDPKAKPKPKTDGPMKLTYISFGKGGSGGLGSMYANSKTNKATFLENVARAGHAVREPQHRNRPGRDARPPAARGDVPARRPAGRVQPGRQNAAAEGDDRQRPRLRAGAGVQRPVGRDDLQRGQGPDHLRGRRRRRGDAVQVQAARRRAAEDRGEKDHLHPQYRPLPNRQRRLDQRGVISEGERRGVSPPCGIMSRIRCRTAG